MAEFCRECANEVWGNPDHTDFDGCCEEEDTIVVLCEGCGWIVVDCTGKKIRKAELKEIRR